VGRDAVDGWRLGYQPQLGHPWFELVPGVPIYLPPAFFLWWCAYDASAPRCSSKGPQGARLIGTYDSHVTQTVTRPSGLDKVDHAERPIDGPGA
jgi:hypothetical protein